MNWHVLMTALKTTVLLNEVEVVPANDDCAVHLGLENDSGEDVSSDRNVSGPWALLIDVGAINSLKAKTNDHGKIASFCAAKGMQTS